MMSLLTTVLGGPLFGVVGSVVTNLIGSYQEAKRQQREYEHIEKMTKLNAEFKAQEAEHELTRTQVEAGAAGLKASYQHDALYGAVSMWAANILRFVRPGLTFLLLGLVAVFFFAGDVDRSTIVLKVTFMAEMAVSWWFVDRRIQGK